MVPEWGNWRRVAGTLSHSLSEEVLERIQAWNTVWQTILNPQSEIRWPDSETGRRWIVEGKSLVEAIQAEAGPSVRVVEGFAAYDPDTDTPRR